MRSVFLLLFLSLGLTVQAQEAVTPAEKGVFSVTVTKDQSATSTTPTNTQPKPQSTPWTTATNTQTKDQSYNLGSGDRIRIRNVSGDIQIQGYGGNTAQVRTIKEGRNPDEVEIVDESNSNAIDLSVKYLCKNCSISVRFEIQVPRNLLLNLDTIETVSGDINIRGLRADVRTRTASGDVTVQNVSGSIDAQTASGTVRLLGVNGSALRGQSASGDIEVSLDRVNGIPDWKFATVSGDVRVSVPSQFNAQVNLETTTGDVRTNLPINVTSDRYSSGERASGRVGTGEGRLRATTVSGSVTVKVGN